MLDDVEAALQSKPRTYGTTEQSEDDQSIGPAAPGIGSTVYNYASPYFEEETYTKPFRDYVNNLPVRAFNSAYGLFAGATMDPDTSPPGDYFETNPPPKSLTSHKTLAKAFIDQHHSSNRRVVLVTSGGTTVPLENQTVRFIDNFSAGTRGATSAEYFLEAGYAVIFLHRQFSLLPYSRHYSHTTNCFLDYLSEGADGSIDAKQEYQEQMREVLAKYNTAKRENTLLVLPFTSVTDYLWELKEIAILMRPLGPTGLFYLAAAVSDFFIPKDRMAEHKIQSSNPLATQPSEAASQSQKLLINLDPVPKFLKSLISTWAPQGMIISFKLETDPSILLSKSRSALEKYSHHLVIGNLLSTRKWEVVFVAPDAEEHWIRVPLHRRVKSISDGAMPRPSLGALEEDVDDDAQLVDVAEEMEMGEGRVEIESLIVPEVEGMHGRHIKSHPFRSWDS